MARTRITRHRIWVYIFYSFIPSLYCVSSYVACLSFWSACCLSVWSVYCLSCLQFVCILSVGLFSTVLLGLMFFHLFDLSTSIHLSSCALWGVSTFFTFVTVAEFLALLPYHLLRFCLRLSRSLGLCLCFIILFCLLFSTFHRCQSKRILINMKATNQERRFACICCILRVWSFILSFSCLLIEMSQNYFVSLSIFLSFLFFELGLSCSRSLFFPFIPSLYCIFSYVLPTSSAFGFPPFIFVTANAF